MSIPADPSAPSAVARDTATATGVVSSFDRRGAALFGGRAVLVLALLALGMLGAERLILRYPARLGPLVSGFPTDRVLELQRTPGEIVFFGDSVVQTMALGDADPRLLPDMLAGELDEPVLRISQAATGAQMHAAWLRYAARLSPPPRAVIIPINLRSFSPHWERNPGWVFDDVAAMIDHPLYARLGSVLEWDWGRPTDEAFAASPIIVGGVEVGTIATLDDGAAGWAPSVETRRSRYLVRYASDITRSRRLGAFRALVAEANASRFPVILYLTPVDIDVIEEHVDAATLAAVQANLAVLREALADTRWPSVDLSEAVRAADFDHPIGDPHEHLKWGGRIACARALAEAVREAGVGMPAPPPVDAEIEDAGVPADAGAEAAAETASDAAAEAAAATGAEAEAETAATAAEAVRAAEVEPAARLVVPVPVPAPDSDSAADESD